MGGKLLDCAAQRPHLLAVAAFAVGGHRDTNGIIEV